MSELFTSPFLPAFNTLGGLAPGAKLYFYATGTTTLATVYADAALTTPLANPVVANIGGAFASIYLDSDVVYRAVLKTAQNATIDDADPVNPATSDAGASINVRNYGTLGDGVTNDTAAFQAAINEALTSKRSLFVPEGRYLVDALDGGGYLQGRLDMYGEAESWLVARSNNIVVLTLGSGESRLGVKGLRRIKIDGNGKTGVTGIKMGDANRALLHLHLQDVFVQSCALGYDIGNVQESIFTNVIARYCTTGTIVETDATLGGATTLLFNKPAWQECTVGFLVKSNSIYPVSTWQLNQPLFQSNYLCGMSIHGAVGGNGAFTSTTLIVPHFEGNGGGTTEGDTAVIRGCTVIRAALHLNAASVSMETALGDGQATITLVKLRNGSLLDVQGGDLAAGDKGVFDCDTSSRVTTSGLVTVGGQMNGVADWGGLYMRTGGVRGSIIGVPTVTASPSVANRYGGLGGLPDAPEAEDAIACTPSKILDPVHGMVQRVTYGATPLGYSGTNNVKFKVFTGALAVNDNIAISFLVKASVATTMGFYIQGAASQLRGPASIAVGTSWQRVVFFGRVETAEAAGLPMYAYPVGTDSPVVDYAKMQVVVTPAADTTLDAINQVLRLGAYDNMRQPIYNDVAPASGTWRVGQIAYFRVPTAGGYIGAVCTTAGTPGTWKSFGAIVA